jgi:spore coat-associated protein N
VSGLPAKLRIHGSRIAVSLLVIAVAGATCAAAFALGPGDSRGGTKDVFSSAGHAVAGGSLCLKAGAMAPGESVHGRAVVRNDGNASGRFYLNAEGLVDRAGSGGGSLGDVLWVTVTDVSDPDHPATVFAGPFAELSGVDLGSFAQGEARSYRVVVSFPACETDGAAFAGSSLKLGLQWTAVTAG